MADPPIVRFVPSEPEHGGLTAYTVWTAGGDHHGEVEQFPTEYGNYWRAWRHPPSGRVPVVCQVCQAPRRFHRRRDAAAAMLAHKSAYQGEHAALVLVSAALRLLTACDHGEEQAGTCPDCEALPPLVQVALDDLPLLDPNLTDIDPAALHEALRLVETSAGAHGNRDLGRLATALRHAAAGFPVYGRTDLNG